MQDERMNGREQEKKQILDLFRKKGMRITKQRELILDIVLENECSCCKEIYYRAAKKDKNRDRHGLPYDQFVKRTGAFPAEYALLSRGQRFRRIGERL